MSDLKKIEKNFVRSQKNPRLGCESLTPYHRRACGCRADIQVRVLERTSYYENLVNSSGYSSDAACCCSVLLQCAVQCAVAVCCCSVQQCMSS